MAKNNWIFLRGLTRANIHWGDFKKKIQQQHPAAQIEFLEIPGNGMLHDQLTPVNAGEVVAHLREKSQICRSGESFNLCGISLGGMVALKWAELYPEDVNSISLINCSLRQYSTFHQRLNPKHYKKIILALIMASPSEQEKIILKITSNRFVKNSHYLDEFSLFANAHPVTKSNFIRQLVLASLIRIDHVPLMPLKIICSSNDRLVDVKCSKNIHHNLGGKIFIHATAGHDLPLDEPDWLCEILLS